MKPKTKEVGGMQYQVTWSINASNLEYSELWTIESLHTRSGSVQETSIICLSL